jgi:hypothetical protein
VRTRIRRLVAWLRHEPNRARLYRTAPYAAAALVAAGVLTEARAELIIGVLGVLAGGTGGLAARFTSIRESDG